MKPLLRAALMILPLGSPAFAQKNGPPPAMKVGVTTRTVTPSAQRNWRGQPGHTLALTVWYPAIDTAVETPQFMLAPSPTSDAPGIPVFSAGSAMPHAAFAPRLGAFPLILLSHGSGGSALQMAWFGTALARAGYIAVAVDHPGNNTANMTPEGLTLWWERATDLSNVLDALLKDDDLAPHIDRDRIAAAGYSLGGYTVLQLAGARTDIDQFFTLCRAQPNAAVCHIPEIRGMGTVNDILARVRRTSGESLARSSDSFRDPRIHAVFAMAPALGFTQTPESLRAIKLPIELVVGADDRTAPARDNADYLRANIHGARETVLPGAVGHYIFLNTCTPQGMQLIPNYCTDAAGIDRAAIHEQVTTQAIRFFDHALKVH